MNRIICEFLDNCENIRGYYSGEKEGLSRGRKEFEDAVNLVFETSLQIG